MPLYRRQLPSLINGVSQQPSTQRSADQCGDEINAWLSIVDGAGKRSPLEHVAKISSTPLAGAHVHTINRDVDERYTVVLTNGDLQVFGMDGTVKTVAFPGGKSYLNCTDPETDFALVSVADYTFVVNKTVAVALAAAGSDTAAQPNYYFWLPNKTAQGGASQQQYDPNPALLLANLKGDVQTVQDLPATPAQGDIYRITGYGGAVSEFVFRTGAVWQECYKPGIQNALDATTMPWALVRAPDGTFVFAPFSWAPRRVGDDKGNPAPSFVGREIRDVYFWRNRLCLLVGENTIMSRASDFGNFFRMTMTALLPDDVVDVATAETSVNLLNYAVPFQNGLLLFADQAQFGLTTDGPLTPTSVAIQAVTHYKMTKRVRPVACGNEVYFASEPGAGATSNGFTLLHDYFVMPTTASLNTADDITAPVAKFIPAGIRALAASPEYDAAFACTKGAPNTIFVYQAHWRPNPNGVGAQIKVQSAWHHWVLAATDAVLSAAVLDDYAYFVISRADGTYLEKFSLVPRIAPDNMPFNVLLDRRVKVTGTYLPVSDTTEFTLPYPADPTTFQLVAGDAYGAKMGTLVAPSVYQWIAPATVRLPGNWTAGPLYAGAAYTFRHEFNQAYYANSRGEAVTGGRLQLRTWTLNFTQTGYLNTVVSAYGADRKETVVPSLLSEFTGRTIGDAALTLGTPILKDGSYTFTVAANAADAVVAVENPTHVPSTFQSAEYEGFYTSRSAIT